MIYLIYIITKKIKIGFKFSFFLFFLFFNYSLSNAIVYDYNIATIKTTVFNNGLPISTGNVAGVYTDKELVFSGSTLISNVSYNLATVRTLIFNNGLPISTGNVAKVIVDITVGLGIGESIENDIYYNIATVRTLTFNNGLPISTGKVAKVVVDETIGSGTGEVIGNINSYNLATVRTLTFNNGLPITTGKTAKVITDFTIGSTDGFLYSGNEINFNIASIRTLVFNNGLPITTGKTAKVIIQSNSRLDENSELYTVTPFEDYTGDQTVDFNVEIGSGKVVDSVTDGGMSIDGRIVYTNSTNFVYLGKNPNNDGEIKITMSDDSINNVSITKGDILIHGDNGYFQKIVKVNNLGGNLEFGDKIKLSTALISDDLSYFRQEINFIDTPLPPVLLYPYYLGEDSPDSYVLRNNYPTIKGMAMPNSVIKAVVGSDNYFINTDENGLFSFRTKKLVDTDSLIVKFQYEILEGNYTDHKLEAPIQYSLQVRTTELYDQPYISNIYNDDDIYDDLIYIEGYANTGSLNYDLYDINKVLISSGTTVVGEDNRFSSIIGSENLVNLDKNNYIIEVRQDINKKERKAFTLFGSTSDRIGVLNYDDYDYSIVTKPTILGYSKSTDKNNTIRVYACEVGDGSFVTKCDEGTRIFLGTTSSDSNGFFRFESLINLDYGKMYLINLYNTSNLNYHKNLILNIVSDNEYINNSKITNIISGIGVNKNIVLKGYSLSGSTINIVDNGNSIYTGDIKDNGYYDIPLKLDTGNIEINYSRGLGTYTKSIDVNISENNNYNNNYFQYFGKVNNKIINEK